MNECWMKTAGDFVVYPIAGCDIMCTLLESNALGLIILWSRSSDVVGLLNSNKGKPACLVQTNSEVRPLTFL